MRGRNQFTVLALIVPVLLCSPANAGILGGGFSGALRGAVLGSLIDGRDGAGTGAVIGGMIGAGQAAAQEKKRQEMQLAARRRQDEWAAREQAQRERYLQQQAAQAPQREAEQLLIVETQKSLIRLGYEPGELGQAGPALTGAVRAYQRRHNLLETGELSQALLNHMLRNGG
jgi:outer membrane lipoprotein SlyB